MINRERKCVVCDVPIPTLLDRCTNGCCIRCHNRFCTSGGTVAPGHNLNVVDARRIMHTATKG